MNPFNKTQVFSYLEELEELEEYDYYDDDHYFESDYEDDE